MNIRFSVLTVVLVCLFLSACSDRLTGTWKVQKYETVIPGEQTVTLSNIGTMTFNKDFSGVKDIHYNVFGEQRNDSGAFVWSHSDAYVTIKANDSNFSKTWLVKEDGKKMQRWQSTDGRGQIQTLELRR
jgi:deferrochelatase/peroxidase EfeB